MKIRKQSLVDALRGLVLVSVMAFATACSTGKQSGEQNEQVVDTATMIVNKMLARHGSAKLIGQTLSFEFRGTAYSVSRTPDTYIYTRTFQSDSLGFVQDTLVNSSQFSRHVNGTRVELSEEWKRRYANSVNSVLYFMQLPLGLVDPAVRRTYLGLVTIRGKKYHKLKVTFGQEGGGEDFDDVYCYWVDAEQYTLDYLGYEYSTEGGGTRFREAVNRLEIGGIIFQDYINYKASDKTTPILVHDQLFEEGQLTELSRIENTNIVLVPNP